MHWDFYFEMPIVWVPEIRDLDSIWWILLGFVVPN
jgi:hypothetical protein